MNHEMKIKQPYFDKIQNGKKIYEIRLNDEKRKLINVGDSITFKENDNLDNYFKAKVDDLICFDSFTEMISTLPPEKVGFENLTNNQIVDIYHQFYSAEEEKKYGVLAIKIQI